jgi:quercetin dioxygenase-like cupin family protein
VITGTLEPLELGNLRIGRFHFTAGSRLGWHTHLDGPQLLMMEDGRGRLQERGGPVIDMLPNVPYVTLAGIEHWHGAAPDEAGTQWNIYDGIGVPGSVTWGDAVTDEEYNAPVGR